MSINFEKLKWGIRALLNKPLYGKMGKMCYIGRPCFIANKKRIKMKNRVRIYPGMRSETLDGGTVEIGNNVSIGQNFHIVAAEKRFQLEIMLQYLEMYLSRTVIIHLMMRIR